MKTILASLVFFLITGLSYGQSTLIGFKLSVGSTITRLKDLDHAPSGGRDAAGYLRNPADGSTFKAKDKLAVSAGANLDLPFSDQLYLSTGLWFTSKAIEIGNRDGGYLGYSTYKITYLQIPLAAKVYKKEIAPNLDLYGKLGLTFDLRLKEEVENDYDGAHFWNLAKMRYDRDQVRGINGDYEVKPLFNPLNIGVLASVGGEFKITDKVLLFVGLTFNGGLFNTINPSLKHDDWAKTPVADGLKIRTHVFCADFGVILPL